jgi:hypothetical protein
MSVVDSQKKEPSVRKQSRKERIAHYKATHKLLCSQCEGKTVPQLMIENMDTIPFLVKSKCSICGHDGMLVEILVKEVT